MSKAVIKIDLGEKRIGTKPLLTNEKLSSTRT